MDLHHLRCFIAVAEECHFGRAADRLHLTISPVSRAVKELESQLGTLLFVRSHHSVEPTPYARTFLPKAIDVVSRFDALVNEAGSTTTATPTLRLGVSSLIDTAVIDAVTNVIQEACTRTNLETHVALSDDLVELLNRDALDLAVIHLPTSSASVQTSLLAQYTFAVAMNSQHPLADRNSVTVADISPYTLLMSGLGANTAIAARFSGLLRGLGVARMKVLAQEDTLSIAGRLSRGDAISLVALGSVHAEKTFDAPRFRLVPFDAAGLEVSVGLAWTQRSALRCPDVETVVSYIPAMCRSIQAM
jgi:DNA-binding transcriptional LysR family regulator